MKPTDPHLIGMQDRQGMCTGCLTTHKWHCDEAIGAQVAIRRKIIIDPVKFTATKLAYCSNGADNQARPSPSQWCILHILPYFHKIYKFSPYISANYIHFPLIYAKCTSFLLNLCFCFPYFTHHALHYWTPLLTTPATPKSIQHPSTTRRHDRENS